jgi:hypothetical protein
VSGVTPTTTDAVAVFPVIDVAVAVYRVAVVGVTFLLPEEDVPPEGGAVSTVTVLAFELFQLKGA